MSKMNPKVDGYLRKAKQWREEVARLRNIILDCQLTEALKWGKPCYTLHKSNVVIIIGLKEHCALMFCKGALLSDAHGLLTKPGENTQAGRWIKFRDVHQISELEPVLKSYILEAVEVQKAGLEVAYKETSEYVVPAELQNKLENSPALKAAFAALTPGRQRGYLLYFSAAKQSRTRESRVEKWMPQILAGKGLNDAVMPARTGGRPS